jgi:hypothetical protein
MNPVEPDLSEVVMIDLALPLFWRDRVLWGFPIV